jgi:hypothetical protein
MGHNSGAGIRGIASHFPNIHVDTLKSSQWAAILRVLGKGGEKVMSELLIGCGIFVAVSGGQGNFYQLSGMSTDRKAIVLSCNFILIISVQENL